MARAKPPAIFFDLDGTLIDSAPDLGGAAEQMLAARGLPTKGLDAYRLVASAGARGILKVAFDVEPSAAHYEDLRLEFLANYERCMADNTYAFAGVTELLQGRGLKDLDVFTPPTFDDEEVAEHTNLETHFIDSSGLISWDLFKQDADYPFVDWNFSGTTEEEFATLMAIFNKEDKEVYIADYEHLGVYACRIIVPGMSDIYPAEDLWLANNSMGSHLRETILSLPGSEWEKEDYLNLIEQLDEEGFDDFTRVRELLGLATGSDNGWYTLRIGELKAMLALAGGDLEQALVWTEWTMEFNSSVFSPERANYYRCLQTLLLLAQEEDRQPLQYLNAFVRMYGADAVEAASAAMSGEAAFYGLQPVDSDLHAFAAHQSLLKAYEKLQRAKAAFWAK